MRKPESTAIRKIRVALEDDSAQPRFLQTVVGRGYRFVAEVDPEISPSEEFSVSAEEFGRAVLAAAGLDLHDPKAHRK